jgi:hypothetical protein
MKSLRSLAASLLAAAFLIPGSPAAQPAETWKYEASLYFFMSDVGGRVTFPATGASKEAIVDISEILENLKFGFMGSFEARRGRWGVFTDFAYMDVGNVQENSKALSIGRVDIPADVNVRLSFDLKLWAGSLVGTYALVADPDFQLDVLAGTRVLDVRPRVDYALSGNVGPIALPDRAGRREVKEQNWDALIGVKGRAGFSPDGGKWFVPYYFDIGTGESKLTFQAMAGVGYGFGWGDVTVAWRYLDYQMKSGKPIEELTFNGPQIAALFRW